MVLVWVEYNRRNSRRERNRDRGREQSSEDEYQSENEEEDVGRSGFLGISTGSGLVGIRLIVAFLK